MPLVNLATFERAEIAAWAYRRARHTGSLDCMKALCYVLRNRAMAGWGGGTWLSLLRGQEEIDGNELGISTECDPQDRLLQMLVHDIDDIHMGISSDDTKRVVQDALYFQFIDQIPRSWFVDKIVRQPEAHPRIAQVGPIALFR
jgi:hypothetical protein